MSYARRGDNITYVAALAHCACLNPFDSDFYMADAARDLARGNSIVSPLQPGKNAFGIIKTRL